MLVFYLKEFLIPNSLNNVLVSFSLLNLEFLLLHYVDFDNIIDLPLLLREILHVLV